MGSEVGAGHGKAAGLLSTFLIVFGLIDAIVGFVYASYGGTDGNGIWIGILLLLNGILGVITWAKLNKTVMAFFMVMCILNIILCVVQTILAAIGYFFWQVLKAAISTKCRIKNHHCDCGTNKVPMELEDCSWIAAFEQMFLILMILNGLTALFVFAGSIIGCVSTCCASDSPQQSGGVVVVQQHPTQTVMTGANGQPVFVGAGQPTVISGAGGQPIVIGGGQPMVLMQTGGYGQPGSVSYTAAQPAPPPAYTEQQGAIPGQYPMAEQDAALPAKAVPPAFDTAAQPAPHPAYTEQQGAVPGQYPMAEQAAALPTMAVPPASDAGASTSH